MISYILCVDENSIGALKMKNNYGAVQLLIFQYWDSNIEFFSIAPGKVIALNLLCCISLSKVIALQTIALVIDVALSRS